MNKKMLLYVAGTVLLSLFTMGVAALQSQAATKPNQSYTEYFVGGSLTPVFTLSTATPTLKDFTPSPTTRPRPTDYNGPTVTASGPLIALNETFLRALYERIPPTIGGLKTITYETYQNFGDGSVNFALEDSSGTKYVVEVDNDLNAHIAYMHYLNNISVMRDRQSVQAGDLASVAPLDRWITAAMKYRNVFIVVYSASYSAQVTTPTAPLSEEQLAQVLQDLFAWLSGTERF